MGDVSRRLRLKKKRKENDGGVTTTGAFLNFLGHITVEVLLYLHGGVILSKFYCC